MNYIETLEGLGVVVNIRKKIVEMTSEFQKIEIYETEKFGKMLTLDGKVQLTERDESHYHEMLVHVPLLSHPDPRHILIIGGGDGGALREALKHSPEKIVMVEIDPMVVKATQKFLRIDRGAFRENTVEIYFSDGIEYLKNSSMIFDVILVDSTDPNKVSSTLIASEFFHLTKEKLKRGGLLALQSQTPYLQADVFKSIHSSLKGYYRHVHPYLAYVPSYPSGMWSFIIASDTPVETNIDTMEDRMRIRKIETKYYVPEMHSSAFILPKWVKELIE